MLAAFWVAAPAWADHNADEHSANMSLLGNFDDGGDFRMGSDLAFWGTTAVLGNYDEPGGFWLVDISNPAAPTEIGQLRCPGPQNDVAIWDDLVFLSVDSPRSSPDCGAGGASQAQVLSGAAWEGVRVISIADPANPTQIAAVKTDCGSHTHTLVPDEPNNRVLIYVHSYPLGGQGANCNAATHRKISVIEVPLANPAAARVVSTPSVNPAVGCHDTTVFLEPKIAASACITESQIWDISDPVNPTVIAHIANPSINIHHSTTFSWESNTLVIGDEVGGAAVSPGCGPGGDHIPLGALWFYDISNRRQPLLRGSYKIPQNVPSILCTAHNFNSVPLPSGKDILVSAWYNGGTSVLDYTDPSRPRQIGFYVPKQPVHGAAWSSHWYDGLIYANNFDVDVHGLTEVSRGFDVLSMTHPDLAGAVALGRLNPQTMESFLPRTVPGVGGAPSPKPPPRLRLTARCSRGKLRAAVRGRDRGEIDRVDFYIGRRHVARDTRSPFVRRIDTRRLRRGRRHRLRADVLLEDGRRAGLSRRFSPCARAAVSPRLTG